MTLTSFLWPIFIFFCLKLLNESHDMLAKEPCPFKMLEYLNMIPPPNTPAVELLESVKAYLLKKCPEAVVDAMYRYVCVFFTCLSHLTVAYIGF